MRVIEWEIKVTKLCNLRCAYCYEFDELGDPHRLSLCDWRAILLSARWYHEELARRLPSEEVHTRFVWHGGESSVLPVAYYREVLALQSEVMEALVYVNHASTNLYRLPAELLELWDRERFVLAVSYDGTPGARVTARGEHTETAVEENLRTLLSTPRTIGCNSVLTANNQPHLVEIYDRLRDIVHSSAGNLYWNLIPIHSTSKDHQRTAPFLLDKPSTVDSLIELFEHWLDDPDPISVSPLQQHYLAVARKTLGLPIHHFSRRSYGETSLTVNTDGYVYLFRDAYDRPRSLGCIFDQPFSEMMQSPAYAASLQRTETQVQRLCHGCSYDGHCNHGALIYGHIEHGERCGMVHQLLRAMEAKLSSRGIQELMHAGAWHSVPNDQFLLRREAAP